MKNFFATIMIIRRILTHDDYKEIPLVMKKSIIAGIVNKKMYDDSDDNETTEIKNAFGLSVIMFLMGISSQEALLSLIENIMNIDPELKEFLLVNDDRANEAVKLRSVAEEIIKEGGLTVEL